MPTPKITIQELTLTLAAPDCNPILLTPNFLKGSGIIPNDWELARKPTLTPQIAQISFTNGINLISQPGNLTLIQALAPDTDPDSLQTPELAQKYIQALPNLDYQAVAINPRTFITFPDDNDDAAQQYLNSLLAPAPWQHAGTAPLKATLNLNYTFDGRTLNLSINEIKLQKEDQTAQHAVLFSGNVPQKISAKSEGEKLEQLRGAINQWRPVWDTYQGLFGQFV
ncbi:MAG: hypothetical protein F6J87_30890 [Spirulina sp. SIO3F2]|nr:hypothetical protein [Spirulina sp. SIO3F2]